ncbi:lycopene cyclase family protein [Belliella kenyensis]|uniref:Lycopene cyclase family protein n=1 Tax=Belliella kenyensis TaxID=1472724 RepID=A0ABV8ELG9_9BACT|nr:lycopene cyclase family protein [Belliella kenyensis]MCH7403303.1 lycopene cyclase family protein [Belliella kenyensis]MDN3602944.1 lycopene cyclase family protein [Belliella kenyensis]
MEKRYDYIIAGAGLAGLSLLDGLLKSEKLRNKRILVLEKSSKSQNDRTWCFWEMQPGPFEHLVVKSWKNLRFLSPSVNKTFQMKEYSYKMIQSGDFYSYVRQLATSYENVTFLDTNILSIKEHEGEPIVHTDHGVFYASYIFNSTGLFFPPMSEENTILQHFMGWFIQTDKPAFDKEVGTLMDFTLSQHHGTTFMYVLPTSDREALVEYTLFSKKELDKNAYEEALEAYIEENIGLKSPKIIHKEYGVIPMSIAKFPTTIGPRRRIINIGTAGGHTKASSGYTFQFVQAKIQRMLGQLEKGNSPVIIPSLREKMFEWYDRVLVDVLLQEKVSGEFLFSSLFQKNDPERILAFLANQSGFWEEFKIRDSVPFWPFFTSGMKHLIK